MSGSTREKIAVVLVFVLFGLPAGLCSILFTSGFARNGLFVAAFYEKGAFGILLIWLSGFVIAFFLFRWVIRVFSS